MKKVLLTTSMVAVLTLSGCMSTGTDTASLANNNYEEMSCEEINAVFAEIDGNNATVSSLTGMASAFGVNTAGVGTAQAQANQVIFQAKNIARPIAVAKGCQTTF